MYIRINFNETLNLRAVRHNFDALFINVTLVIRLQSNHADF
jgi:hypothetical protein